MYSSTTKWYKRRFSRQRQGLLNYDKSVGNTRLKVQWQCAALVMHGQGAATPGRQGSKGKDGLILNHLGTGSGTSPIWGLSPYRIKKKCTKLLMRVMQVFLFFC